MITGSYLTMADIVTSINTLSGDVTTLPSLVRAIIVFIYSNFTNIFYMGIYAILFAGFMVPVYYMLYPIIKMYFK